MKYFPHKSFLLVVFIILLPFVASADWGGHSVASDIASLLQMEWVRVLMSTILFFCFILKIKKKFSYSLDPHILVFDAWLAIYLFLNYAYPYRMSLDPTKTIFHLFIKLFFKRDIFLGIYLLLHIVNISFGLLKTHINTQSK